jgi:hypothetical protein
MKEPLPSIPVMSVEASILKMIDNQLADSATLALVGRKRKLILTCPKCGHEFEPTGASLRSVASALMGSATGSRKARTHKQAVAAGKAGAKARWDKVRAEKAVRSMG